MATGGRRDDAALRQGLDRWVSANPALVPGAGNAGGPPPRIAALAHAEGGMANETVLVDLGPEQPGMVVRLPPLVPTFPGYDLGPQATVQNAVAAAGVAAPSPALVVGDPRWIGSPFLVMPRVHGDIPGPAPVFDPYVIDAAPELQQRMYHGLLDTLAAIHAVPWVAAGLGAVVPGVGLRDAVDRWSAYLDWSSEGEPLPALASALEWCRGGLAAERPAVLLWGDVRRGNLVFDDVRQVTGVLDWDLAALGPPGMDLGWHFGLEFMMGTLFGRRVPGFPGREESLARYEGASGHTVEDDELAWHEVFALARALAINDRHQRITGEVRRTDNPMGAVLLERLAAAG